MFLGLDVGTGSAKALLLDDRGNTIAEAGAAYAVDAPRPGWRETHPNRWWQAIVDCVNRLPRDARAAAKAIGLSGQMHGVVLVADNGEPLRPAILWLDQRALDLVARYPAGSEQRVGNPISAGMAGPILLWLAAHEEATLRAARWALLAKDWLRVRLTGVACSEPSDASGTLLADRNGQWDQALLADLGLSRALLPPIVGCTEVSGHLTEAAAEALGLPAGIAVAGGAGDTPAAAFGSGLYRHGAAQLTIGSGAQIVVMQAARPQYSPRLNAYCSASAGDLPRWYAMAAMLNAGIALEWARAVLGLTWDEAYARAFTPQAEKTEAMFVPYLAGERTPWMNPNVRGAWVGLSATDDPGSMMRAAFVGVAFGIRAGLDALHEHAIELDRLRLAGGGSVSKVWQQLLVDVLGVPLDVVACPNASARGAALLAGLASGAWKVDDLEAMAPAVTPAGEPRTRSFEDKYVRFRALYDRLAGWHAPGTQPK